MIVRELVAKFGFNVDKSGLDRADAAIGKTKKNSLDLGKIAGGAMAALGAMGIKQKIDESVAASNEFGESMGKIQSLIPGNVARADEYSAAIKRLALEFGTTSADVAAGAYDVVSTFGDTADAIDQVSIAVKAGAAANATTKDGLALLGAVTKAYGDTSAATMQKVSDLGFQTVNLGKVELPELAASIGQVTPLASNLGVKMEEVFAVMASASGVTGSGSEVMTQMASAMQALLNKTPAMKVAYKKVFGKELLKDAISKDGVVGVFKKLAGTTDGSVESIQKLFGRVEGLKLILQLTGNGAKDFTDKMAAMGNVMGLTNTAYAASKGGLAANATQAAKTAEKMAQLKIAIGDDLAPAVGRFNAEIATAVEIGAGAFHTVLTNMKTDTGDASGSMKGLGESVRPVTVWFAKLALVADTAAGAVNAVIDASDRAEEGIAGFASETWSSMWGGSGGELPDYMQERKAAREKTNTDRAARMKSLSEYIVDPEAATQKSELADARKQAITDANQARLEGIQLMTGAAAGDVNIGAISLNVALPAGTAKDQAKLLQDELYKMLTNAGDANARRTDRSNVGGASNAGTNAVVVPK